MRCMLTVWISACVVSFGGVARAAPECAREDVKLLCEIAQDTLADNPSFAEMREGGVAAEQARQERHAARRARVRSLVNETLQPTWRDLYRAGYVMAYGSSPEEDLLAHAIAIRALSLAPDESDVRFLVAMTMDEIGRRYAGAQLYGRQKYFAFDPQTGSVRLA